MRTSGVLLSIIVATALGNSNSAEAARLSGEHYGANTKYSYSVVRGMARAGKRSQRFELRAGDCHRDQSPFKCGNEHELEGSTFLLNKSWKNGTNQWIGFSIFLPSDFRTSSRVNTTVGNLGSGTGPSVMRLEMLGDSFFMPVFRPGSRSKNFPLARVSEMRGRWTDIAVHFDTSEGQQLLEVFVNRKPRGKIENWRNFHQPRYLFNYGISRSGVSEHGGPMPTQILYIDEVRMGRSADKVIVNEKRPVD